MNRCWRLLLNQSVDLEQVLLRPVICLINRVTNIPGMPGHTPGSGRDAEETKAE